jgi:hypothetical protein
MTKAILFLSDHIQRYIQVSEIRKVELSWNSPYQFWQFPKVIIPHKYLVGISIWFLSDWCLGFELYADLLKCQIFSGVSYYIHDRYYVRYCIFPLITLLGHLICRRLPIRQRGGLHAKCHCNFSARSDTADAHLNTIHRPANPFKSKFVTEFELLWTLFQCEKWRKKISFFNRLIIFKIINDKLYTKISDFPDKKYFEFKW